MAIITPDHHDFTIRGFQPAALSLSNSFGLRSRTSFVVVYPPDAESWTVSKPYSTIRRPTAANVSFSE